MREQISAACQTAMPTGKQEASSRSDPSGRTGASDHHPSAAASFSGIQVSLVPDEAVGRVTVTFLRRNSTAEGELISGREQQPLAAVLQQEEAERKFSSPDRPQGMEPLNVSRAEGPKVPTSPWAAEQAEQAGVHVLRELREGVVALTERAACLEGPDGAADNQPEVHKVAHLLHKFSRHKKKTVILQTPLWRSKVMGCTCTGTIDFHQIPNVACGYFCE